MVVFERTKGEASRRQKLKLTLNKAERTSSWIPPLTVAELLPLLRTGTCFGEQKYVTSLISCLGSGKTNQVAAGRNDLPPLGLQNLWDSASAAEVPHRPSG